MKKIVAGVVVLYNPNLKKTKENIDSYIYDIDKLYVVDNSDVKNNELIEYVQKFNNIEYTSFGENKGIAFALNTGAENAIKDGYKWLLTMDQDSLASKGMIQKMINFAIEERKEKIAIIAAQPDTPIRAKRKTKGWMYMDSVITSGNLVNLEAYLNVNGFEDKLFIDYVDCVFSLSVRAAGYKIIQLNDAVLNHNLGESQIRYFFGIKMIPTNHNCLRKYYITRNRFYARNKFKKIFPEFIKFDRINLFKEIIKLFLYEKSKIKKIRFMYKGWIDYRMNKFYKYSE